MFILLITLKSFINFNVSNYNNLNKLFLVNVANNPLWKLMAKFNISSLF